MYSNFQKYFYIFNTLIMRRCPGDNFQLNLVFIKNNNQIKFYFLKKKLKTNRNRFKPTGFGSVF
jgi:hypothetical protein